MKTVDSLMHRPSSSSSSHVSLLTSALSPLGISLSCSSRHQTHTGFFLVLRHTRGAPSRDLLSPHAYVCPLPYNLSYVLAELSETISTFSTSIYSSILQPSGICLSLPSQNNFDAFHAPKSHGYGQILPGFYCCDVFDLDDYSGHFSPVGIHETTFSSSSAYSLGFSVGSSSALL